jgi:hypothetical protein
MRKDNKMKSMCAIFASMIVCCVISTNAVSETLSQPARRLADGIGFATNVRDAASPQGIVENRGLPEPLQKIDSLNGWVRISLADRPVFALGMVREYAFKNKRGSVLRLRLFISMEDRSAAADMIMESMADCTLPIDALIARLNLRPHSVGEQAVGRRSSGGPEIFQFAFVRGDVGVQLDCADSTEDLLPIASYIDSTLLSRPAKGIGKIRCLFPAIPDSVEENFRMPLSSVRATGGDADAPCELIAVGSMGHIRMEQRKGAKEIAAVHAGDESVALVAYDPKTMVSQWHVASTHVRKKK